LYILRLNLKALSPFNFQNKNKMTRGFCNTILYLSHRRKSILLLELTAVRMKSC